jgi:tetratricopeptide (TPR) repeat protein
VSVVEEDLRAKPDADILRALSAQWLLRGKISDRDGVPLFQYALSRSDGKIVLRETVEGAEPIHALERISGQVMKTLSVSADAQTIESRRTPSFDAYLLYLEARAHHDGWFVEGDLEEARSVYQRALKIDPSFAAAFAGQALVSASRYLSTREPGDMAVARYASERALALGDKLPEAHIARAAVLAADENWDGARTSFARAFELAPADYAARRYAADLYETLGRSEAAQALYEGIVAEQPLYWYNHYWHGRFLYRRGNLKAAAVSLERARALAPEAEPPVTLLGFCQLATGDLEEARRSFEKALELSPEPRARQRLGLVQYYAHQFDSALELWSQVLSAEPDSPAAHADVADALRQLGRVSEAQRHYRTALDLYDRAPDSETDVQAQRAQVLAATGRCREATHGMERVLEDHPGDPVFLYYGALTAARCRLDEWARELVLESVGAGNVVSIWFDPDLETVRRDPRVRRPLDLIGSPE